MVSPSPSQAWVAALSVLTSSLDSEAMSGRPGGEVAEGRGVTEVVPAVPERGLAA